MSELQLEVGKSYVRRKGGLVKIIDSNSIYRYPFKGDDGRYYMCGGKWMEGHETEYDLVAEAPDENRTARTDVSKKTAADYLRIAEAIMQERGEQYDSPKGERSMGKTVAAFNTITGRDLTEAEGWLFMSVLKKVRQYQGSPHEDSCEDDVAYAALFAEARMKEVQS